MTDLLTRLEQADPAVGAHPDPAMMAALRERATATEIAPGRPGSRRPLRLAVAVAGTAVVIAAGAVVAPWGGDPVARADAAGVLNAAADRAAAGPSLFPGPGEYHYVRTAGVFLEEPPVMAEVPGMKPSGTSAPGTARRVSRTHELWIAPDGGGRIVTDGIDEVVPSGDLTVPFGDRSLTWAELQALPTDPDRLAEVITGAAVRNSHPLGYQALVLVADVLRTAPVSPAMGAAFYRALASQDGIEALGERTDSRGRVGQAVGAVSAEGNRMELIIDARTGQLLEDREVAASTGDVLSRSTYETRGVVDSVEERPGGPGGS